MALQYFILFYVFLMFHGTYAALPLGWKACKLSMEGYEDCLSKEITKAIKTLKGGNRDMGVNSIDPLRVLKLEVTQGSGPISINLFFKDIEITGLSNFKILNVTNKNFEEIKGRLLFESPTLYGDYKTEGKILTLPVKGDGKAIIETEKMMVNAVLKLKEVEKKGKKYFEVTKFDVELKPEMVKVNFTNMFDGNKALGDNANNFFNENAVEFFQELSPAISKAFSSALAQISNQIFSKLPVNEIRKD